MFLDHLPPTKIRIEIDSLPRISTTPQRSTLGGVTSTQKTNSPPLEQEFHLPNALTLGFNMVIFQGVFPGSFLSLDLENSTISQATNIFQQPWAGSFILGRFPTHLSGQYIL